jgi:hypothetical protein
MGINLIRRGASFYPVKTGYFGLKFITEKILEFSMKNHGNRGVIVKLVFRLFV